MRNELSGAARPQELPYTDDERVILARVNPVFGEVHDGQRTAFSVFNVGDGQRHALEVAPFYMNKADRKVDADIRHGVWGLTEYDATGTKVNAARMERVPSDEGPHYFFSVRDAELGRSRPATHAEAAYFIKMLGGMAEQRDRAIATGEYPLVKPAAARRRGILPALGGLLGIGRPA